MRRVIAFIMSLVLVVGLVPSTAMADQRATRQVGVKLASDLSPSQISAQAVQTDANLYGDVTVRRLYTRPVTLISSPDSGQKLYRSVEIDLSNPLYDGCDIAIRYTGDTPYLVQADGDWNGWVKLGEGSVGVSTKTVNEATGEKVTVYSRKAYEARWDEKGTGKESVHMYVGVQATSGSNPDVHEQCHLIEMVTLGGPARVNPTASANYHEIRGRSVEQIVESMRAGYNMAGHFEANWVPSAPAKDGGWSYSDLALEAHWTRGVYITRETIHALKGEGFNAIRLPVTWFQHIYPEGDPTGEKPLPEDPLMRYHIDRAWMERIHEVVDWCIADDLYVIVNIHHEDWIDRPDLGTAYTDTDLPVKFKAVWTQIANEFSGYDQHLIFEDMNEPHAWFYDSSGKKDWGFSTQDTVTTVNRLNDDFVKLMRAGFSKESGHLERVLMVAHDTGNGDISMTGFVMPDDPACNLACSVHVYSPHDWTHYFAEGKHAGETGEANVYTPTYRDGVDTRWESIRANYTSQGYPVIVGEFGSYYLGPTRQSDRLDWMAQYAAYAKELGIPLFYWRMDKTEMGSDKKEHVVWSAFDEERCTISDLSRDMIGKWFEILDDEDIRWGSNASIEEGEHAPITDENKLEDSSFPKEVHYVEDENRGSDKSWRITIRATWGDIEGKEVAVKYSGNTPRLGLVRESADDAGKTWQGNWWGIDPNTIDEVEHIAYFKADSIKIAWEKLYDLSTLSHIVVRVPDSGYSPPTPEDVKLSTTIEAVALVHQHEWSLWAPTKSENVEAIEQRTCSATSCPDEVQMRRVHEWGPWQTEKASTCTQSGVQVRTCEHDGAEQRRVTRAKGHWWSAYSVDVEATCEHAGSKSRHCVTCSVRESVALDALGHKWGDWKVTKEPTYEAKGEESRTCAHDPAHVETRELPALVKPDDEENEEGNLQGDGQQENKPEERDVDTGNTSQDQQKAEGSSEEEVVEIIGSVDRGEDLEVDSGVRGNLPSPAKGGATANTATARTGASKTVVTSNGPVGLAVKKLSSSKAAVIGGEKSSVYLVAIDKAKMPDGQLLKITKIGAGAFRGAKLQKVKIGGSVQTIGKEAFKDCRRLSSADIGKNVKAIGKSVFKNCGKLKTVRLRSAKLTKTSFKNIVTGSYVRTLKLVGMTKSQKKRAYVKYGAWVPVGVRLT